MKRSFLASIALLACAALASFAFATYDRVAGAAVSAYARIKEFVAGGIALVAGPIAEVGGPMVILVQVKAFVLRLAKRERPVLTETWRSAHPVNTLPSIEKPARRASLHWAQLDPAQRN